MSQEFVKQLAVAPESGIPARRGSVIPTATCVLRNSGESVTVHNDFPVTIPAAATLIIGSWNHPQHGQQWHVISWSYV